MKRAWSRVSPVTRLAAALALVITGCSSSSGSGDFRNGNGGGGEEEEENFQDLTEAPIEGLPANLFGVLLGKSDAEVEEKVGTAVNRFFGIGTSEPAELVVRAGIAATTSCLRTRPWPSSGRRTRTTSAAKACPTA